MKQVLILLWLSVSCFRAVGQGNGWEWQNPLPTGNMLQEVHLFDAMNAMAVGSAGTILRTYNGGQTWQSLSSGTTRQLLSVQFIDE